MECPKCGSRLYVKNTFGSARVRIQEMACENPKCKCKVVTRTEIVAVDPPRGKGAYHHAAVVALTQAGKSVG